MKFYCIADEDTVRGFRLAAVEGRAVEGADEAAAAFAAAVARKDLDILILTDAVAAGRKIFAEHCSECHGKDAGGARRGPNLRTVAAHEATPGALFYVLTNGVIRRGMPGWSKLPEPERWQLVSFLESLEQERK